MVYVPGPRCSQCGCRYLGTLAAEKAGWIRHNPDPKGKGETWTCVWCDAHERGVFPMPVLEGENDFDDD